MLETAEKLKEALLKCSEGKRIDTLKIAPAISPSVILGFNEETRMNSNPISYLCRI